MKREFRFILLFALITMIGSPAFALKAAVDPTDMGVGARPFGMGRAFSALSDDCNSIFLNPAGLGFTKNPQMTTMYANLLGEINYTLLGFSHAWSSEAIGIGYVQADVGDGSVITNRDPSTGRIIPVAGDPIGYVASALLLSYGGSLRRFTDMDYLKDAYIGATFKIFNQEISGGTVDASATGMEMDIGAIYAPMPWLKVGAFGQNVLPDDFGGVLRWTSGTEEGVYSNAKAGVSVKLLGSDAPWQYNDQELFVSYDIEMSHRPGLHHLGLEWWPINYFACRAGIDQDAVDIGGEIGVDNNLTAGIGLYYNGYEFDYAYHQFSSLPENSTHFFSISLGIFKERTEPAPPPPAPKSRYILSIDPSLEVVIYTGMINVIGEVEPEVEMVRIGEKTAPVNNGRFAIATPVEKIGKNSFIIEALNAVGRKLDEAKLKVLRLPSFDDVPDNYWTGNSIRTMAALGLVQGYPDGNFRPDGDITRAELTTMLVRAVMKILPLVTEPRLFKDVTYKHWAAPFIKEGIERGFVTGYPDKTFRPGSNINRAEGTVLMARFAGILEPEIIYEKPFPDLPINHWAIKIISGAKGAGLLEYLNGKDFGAKKNLTRAEAVEMLSRTKFAQEKAAELLDFGSGY